MICDSFLISAGSKPPQESYIIPRGTIALIMRQVQPHDSRVTSNTKETMDQRMQFSVTLTRAVMQEFRQDRRLTITGDNMIIGFASSGLVNYV